jgi:hypothetical protein
VSGSRLAWLALVLWAVWLYGLQGLLAARSEASAWVPDLALVCLVGFAARTTRERARWAAALFALVRSTTSADPLVACLAGLWIVVELEISLRRSFDLESWLGRAVATALAAFGFVLWLELVAQLRAPLPVTPTRGAFDFAWRAALSCGVAAALLGGVLRALPGLRALRERPWEAAAQLR